MAYFPDLTAYSYGHGRHFGVLHVGWLDGVHPFPTGRVEPFLIEKIKSLASKPVELYRGRHICEICTEPPGIVKTFVPNRVKLIDPECSWTKWASQRWGNGEIRVPGEHVVFAAPVLIAHYIEEHGYLPPAQFLEAVARTQPEIS